MEIANHLPWLNSFTSFAVVAASTESSKGRAVRRGKLSFSGSVLDILSVNPGPRTLYAKVILIQDETKKEKMIRTTPQRCSVAY